MKQTKNTMSKSLEKELSKIENDLKEGKNISPVFTNTKDAIDYLENEKI